MARVDFSNWSDGQLLFEYASRFCEDAFAELHARHHESLHRYLRRKLCVGHDVADDVLQSVWLKLAEKCRTPIDNVLAWLTGVARKMCIDAIRGRDGIDAIEGDIPGDYLPPVDAVCAAEDRAAVSRAVASLDASKRSIVSCVYVHGMTLAETAQQAGSSVPLVQWHLEEAHRKITLAISEIKTTRRLSTNSVRQSDATTRRKRRTRRVAIVSR